MRLQQPSRNENKWRLLKALEKWNVDQSWTLFLDRDGVINRKLENDYVKCIEEFDFIDGVKEAIVKARKLFGRIVVVTNQQGIGKGIMSHKDLEQVHDYMLASLEKAGAQIDKIYYCPELASKNAPCRKPNVGMAEAAKKDFPEIDFSKSIMIGDSDSDIEMGKRCGMKTVLIRDHDDLGSDARVESLSELF